MRSLLVLLALVFTLCPALPFSALAQDAAPAAQAAAEDPPAPSYPDGLDAPGIPVDELRLRLLPLTVDQLGALADAWLSIVQRRTQAVIDLQVTLLTKDTAAAAETRRRLTGQIDLRGEAFTRYSLVVDNFERKGADPAAVATLRAYRNSILIEEKQNADWRTLMDQALAWTTQPDGGIQLAIRIATIIGALIGLFIVAKTIRAFSRRAFSRVPNLSRLLQSFLAMVVYWLVLAFGLMVVLSMLGIDTTPAFALVGGLSFIAAFAFQDTLGNLAAGLMIMFNRPFDEGDYVTVAGTGGTVQSVSVVSTKVTTPDNQVIVIPNSKVWGDVITNVTASRTRRVDLVFGIGYGDSIADAQSILEQVVAAHPMVLSEPEPVIRVNALGASSVDFVCRPWVQSADYWTVLWDLTRQVKEAFDAAGISIPYHQTDMHVYVEKEGKHPTLGAPTGPALAEDGMGRPEGAQTFATGDDTTGPASGGNRD
jgi:small conductance mechanosensitive channel